MKERKRIGLTKEELRAYLGDCFVTLAGVYLDDFPYLYDMFGAIGITLDVPRDDLKYVRRIQIVGNTGITFKDPEVAEEYMRYAGVKYTMKGTRLAAVYLRERRDDCKYDPFEWGMVFGSKRYGPFDAEEAIRCVQNLRRAGCRCEYSEMDRCSYEEIPERFRELKVTGRAPGKPYEIVMFSSVRWDFVERRTRGFRGALKYPRGDRDAFVRSEVVPYNNNEEEEE